MKMKKYVVLVALLTVGVVQADTLDWGGSGAIFGPVGDTDWSNPNSWRNQADGLADLPGSGDTLIIQRYAWGNEGVPGGAWDTGATGAILSTTISGLVNVQLATQDTVPIVGGQVAELNLASGANLQASNLQMAQIANSTATVNMSGDAAMTVGGLFNGVSTSTINMSGTSTLDITVTLVDQGGAWGITMADDAVLTFTGGLPGYANAQITALNVGESIQATDLGGATWQYVVIPEPATLGLIGVFGAGILFVRRLHLV